ncbi:MAG TPA: exodeoxyribonuclease III [Saprospirales bacterium]|nr:exodeoxyribonuclease III [Saprospirales bacterium]HAY70405.1 exodeoxyribonuclease III [Saprospirales bacterium]HRQ30104.1 exodeoxyribonuclease III [Saprospiraceae bacterium]
MRIVTFNVNGIRSAVQKGLWKWVASNNIDVLCLQEVKASIDQADIEEMNDLGYHITWFEAEKKGYSGVATFSKIKPENIIRGIQNPAFDREGRVLRTDFGDLTLLNCYFPSGSSGEDRHDFKMEFLAYFEEWIRPLKTERSGIIVLGDYNIVHQALDIHNPERKDNPSGYRPEERAWMDHWFDSGWQDAFRKMNPDTKSYSWWSYRAGSRQKDKGWRIDYCSVSDSLSSFITGCSHDKNAAFSDHCPVVTDIEFNI